MTSILVDSASKALLAASDSVPAISFLNECTLDTYHVPSVERPNYLGRCFTRTIPVADYPKWTWVRGERHFIATQADVLTHDLHARARLAQAKLRAITQILMHLNTSRNRLTSGIQMQETVYLTKFIEAMRFRDSGYDEDRILEFPYILQYAEFAGISLQQAADDIFLKARFDQHYLLNTEGLRLKYFAIIKSAQTPDDLTGIADKFKNECFSNVMV